MHEAVPVLPRGGAGGGVAAVARGELGAGLRRRAGADRTEVLSMTQKDYQDLRREVYGELLDAKRLIERKRPVLRREMDIEAHRALWSNMIELRANARGGSRKALAGVESPEIRKRPQGATLVKRTRQKARSASA